MSLKFSKKLTLRHQSEFSTVFQERKIVSGEHLLVHFKGNDCNHPRLGLVVGRKVSPRAVIRNRIKRILRELFRLNQEALPAVDLVIRLKMSKVSKNISCHDFESEFLFLMQKLRRNLLLSLQKDSVEAL